MGTRIVLLVLVALLTLPLAQAASPVEAKKRPRTITRTFRNPAPITLPTAAGAPVSADLYPSAIKVNGLKGRVRDVDVVLNDISHAFPFELQVLLVGPRGQTAVVVANGPSPQATDATVRLDDEAAAPFPYSYTPLTTGTYRPANYAGGMIAFNAPAPSANGNAALSVFDGADPTGTWRLFVQDKDGSAYPGAFAGGWELEITTKFQKKKR